MRLTDCFLLSGLVCVAACSQQHPVQTSASQPAAADTPVTGTAASSPQVAPGPDGKSLDIAFRSGSVQLSPVALTQLDGAARLYRDAKPEVMIVAGHADPVGQEFSNVLISARRAAAVKQGLIDRGVPAARLQVVADGSAELVPGEKPTPSAVVTWR